VAIVGLLSEVLERYRGDGAVVEGLRYLASLNEKPLATVPGAEAVRVKISGEKIFALHQSYLTKPLSEGRFEAHKRFIDLQYIQTGTELIRVASRIGGLEGIERKSTEPYDRTRDLEFFQLTEGSNLLMKPGMVAILYPEDLHAPCLASGEPELVQKIVVKVGC
jgi:YhcH/YjgK/YiaL family protein